MHKIWLTPDTMRDEVNTALDTAGVGGGNFALRVVHTETGAVHWLAADECPGAFSEAMEALGVEGVQEFCSPCPDCEEGEQVTLSPRDHVFATLAELGMELA